MIKLNYNFFNFICLFTYFNMKTALGKLYIMIKRNSNRLKIMKFMKHVMEIILITYMELKSGYLISI